MPAACEAKLLNKQRDKERLLADGFPLLFERRRPAERRVIDYAQLRNIALQLALITFVSGFLCFWDLGRRSLIVPDEVVAVQAGQEALRSNHWWLPTVNGRPYWNKPPFKIWLAELFAQAAGPTNFTYRFLDASAGVATAILVFLLARAFFFPSIVGVLAVLCLLGSEAYTVIHGPRVAVQDSFLVMLSTGAMLLCWRMMAAALVENRQAKEGFYLPGMAAGVLCGLAILTKSAAGLLPLFVIAVFWVSCGRMRSLYRRTGSAFLLMAGLSLFIPALYFVPHIAFTKGAFGGLIYDNIYGRVMYGYHDVQDGFYYLRCLWNGRLIVPPLLFAGGLTWAGYRLVRHSDPRCLLLVIWALLPLILFSFARTKLAWYVAPGLPAMALLSAAALERSFAFLRQARRQLQCRFILTSMFAAAFLTGGSCSLLKNLAVVTGRVLEPKRQIELDRLSFALVRAGGQRIGFGLHGVPGLAYDERPYGNILRAHGRELADTELTSAVRDGTLDLLLTNAPAAYNVLAREQVRGYRLIGPLRERSAWLVLLALQDKALPLPFPGQTSAEPFLRLTERAIDFGAPEAEVLYGFGPASNAGGSLARHTTGPNAAVLVDGDYILARLGAHMTLHLSPLSAADKGSLLVTLFLNEHRLAVIEPGNAGPEGHCFPAPGNAWRPGRNALALAISRKDGRPIQNGENLLLVGRLIISLNKSAAALHASGDSGQAGKPPA